jgi:tRNA-dihydrouridine synthase 1
MCLVVVVLLQLLVITSVNSYLFLTYHHRTAQRAAMKSASTWRPMRVRRLHCFSSHMGDANLRKRVASARSADFYNEIGSPKYIAAPMVEHSDIAFRVLTRRHGADLAFSQMFNANTLWSAKQFQDHCDWDRYEDYFSSPALIEEAALLDSNIIVQLAGDNVNSLIGIGKLLQHRVAAVDLNLGCPQKIARKGNYGSFLLPQIDLVCGILSAMTTELACPVTAKVRVLDDHDATLANCKRMEESGLSMLTVHGRTKESNKQYTGPVDWDIIADIKAHADIPVIANGGVQHLTDVARCLQHTKCDGVMSSEALLENPKLFSSSGSVQFVDDFVCCQLSTVDEYLGILRDIRPHLVARATASARPHLFKLLHRFLQAEHNADLRTKLGRAPTFDHINMVFTELKERLLRVNNNLELAVDAGLALGSEHSWYARHQNRTEKRLDVPTST